MIPWEELRDLGYTSRRRRVWFLVGGAALLAVEWVRTLRIASLGDGRWRTQVALRRLVSTDGAAYARLPTQAVEVVVNMNAGVPEVVFCLVLSPYPKRSRVIGGWENLVSRRPRR